MHKLGFSHTDVKPDNILIHEKEGIYIYKLGDLGQITKFRLSLNDQSESFELSEGDGRYLAPEILNWDPINGDNTLVPKADIFSLGLTIFDLAHKKVFGKFSDLRSEVQQNDINLPLSDYSPDFVDLLRKMVDRDPRNRPSGKEILLNPIIRNDIEISYYLLKKEAEELKKIVELQNEEIFQLRSQKIINSTPKIKKSNKYSLNGSLNTDCFGSPSIQATPFSKRKNI